MKIDAFIGFMKSTAGPAPADRLAAFEEALGTTLPEDYREFLIRVNGGSGGGGRFVYKGRGADGRKQKGPSIHHVLGFREEPYFSLERSRDCYAGRIPKALLKIMDDPGGNAICLGLDGPHRGNLYFWDHEDEPDEDEWDGEVETAGNISLIADSFTQFIAGLYDLDKNREKEKQQDIRLAREGAFTPFIEAQCTMVAPNYPDVRQWIRALCVRIIEDKGHLSIHADPLSRELPDLMFWLNQTANTDVGPFTLADMHLLVGKWFVGPTKGFGLRGYALGFIDDWWNNRIKSGTLATMGDGARLSKTEEERILTELQRASGSEAAP